jgi:hypothetical protein
MSAITQPPNQAVNRTRLPSVAYFEHRSRAGYHWRYRADSVTNF